MVVPTTDDGTVNAMSVRRVTFVYMIGVYILFRSFLLHVGAGLRPFVME